MLEIHSQRQGSDMKRRVPFPVQDIVGWLPVVYPPCLVQQHLIGQIQSYGFCAKAITGEYSQEFSWSVTQKSNTRRQGVKVGIWV